MAIKKATDIENKVRIFNEIKEAQDAFENKNNPEDIRLNALEYIINHKDIFYILRVLSELFKENNLKEHVYIDFAFANFDTKPKRREDFEKMIEMLKSDNAYLRNAAIEFLQNYGEEVKPYIEELFNSKDRDIRIFAINILGDVKFEESVNMLRRFILKEQDINALVTAIDYLGEIGNQDDIKLLEALKKEINDSYVHFAIDLAIKRIAQ